MNQLDGGPLPETGRRIVARAVAVEVLARQVLSRLAAVEMLDETDACAVAGTFADRQQIALGAAGLFDQGCGGGPGGVVERGLVQRSKDAVEGIEWVHDKSSSSTARGGTVLPAKEARTHSTRGQEGCHIPFGRLRGRAREPN